MLWEQRREPAWKRQPTDCRTRSHSSTKESEHGRREHGARAAKREDSDADDKENSAECAYKHALSTSKVMSDYDGHINAGTERPPLCEDGRSDSRKANPQSGDSLQ